MYLGCNKNIQNNGSNKRKEKDRNTKNNLNVKVSSLWRRGINVGVVLKWLSSSIVFHIDVLRASSNPEPYEVLFAYIAVAPYAVSLVLIRVDCGLQRPVYYVSKSLHKAKVRYLPLEKAILGSSAWHT